MLKIINNVIVVATTCVSCSKLSIMLLLSLKTYITFLAEAADAGALAVTLPPDADADADAEVFIAKTHQIESLPDFLALFHQRQALAIQFAHAFEARCILKL